MTKRSSVDAEIDRLYQLPLAEFTSARNALAKELGKEGSPIRSLEKPNLAAWVVNQLYWRERATFDRLIAAAQSRHAAHAKRLTGKGGNVEASEKAHATALRAAADAVRDLAAKTGDPLSPATLKAVTDTLQALPAAGPPGRLTGPLAPVGFEALAGLVPAGGRVTGHLTVVPATPVRKPRDAPDDPRAAEREAAAHRREKVETRKALGRARAERRQADTALAAARRTLARAKAERDRLQDQLEFAMKQAADAAAEVHEREQRASRAAQEQSRLESKLAAKP